MYVCMCKAVTDHQIRRAVLEGSHRLNDVSQRLGACTGCGKCADQVGALIQSTLAEVHVPIVLDYSNGCLSTC